MSAAPSAAMSAAPSAAVIAAVRSALKAALSLSLALALAAGCATDDTEPAEPEPGDPSFVRDPRLDVDNRSAPGERRSHNMGLNCMRCHQQLGPGKGRFTIGLTVFGPQGLEPNPILRLYNAPVDAGGTVVAELRGDAFGNVFTTDPMPFPDAELFPVVLSEDGTRRNQMPFPVSSGACNICHKQGFEVIAGAP